jgi:hypothetical protein
MLCIADVLAVDGHAPKRRGKETGSSSRCVKPQLRRATASLSWSGNFWVVLSANSGFQVSCEEDGPGSMLAAPNTPEALQMQTCCTHSLASA